METYWVMTQALDARARVYRLRSACYHQGGAIPTAPDAGFCDCYDESLNHFSFYDGGATVLVSLMARERGWTECPSRSVFGDLPAFDETARSRFVEASRL